MCIEKQEISDERMRGKLVSHRCTNNPIVTFHLTIVMFIAMILRDLIMRDSLASFISHDNVMKQSMTEFISIG